MDYGYAAFRAAIARGLVAHGFPLLSRLTAAIYKIGMCACQYPCGQQLEPPAPRGG